MEEITRQHFDQLLEISAPVSVSLYLPTDPLNPDPRTNSIAFKNAVNHALDGLQKLKVKDKTYETLDAACEQLLDDEVFWKQQSASFALFAADEWTAMYSLPTSEAALTMMTDHLYVLPFVTPLSQPTDFFVIELDKENTRMWRGDKHHMKNVDVPNLPKSVAEVTGVEGNERQLQFHTGTESPKGDMRSAAFHGSSSWKDDKDRYLKQFLQAVDKAVSEYFKDSKHTLYMSGTEELTVMYKQLTKCKCLAKTPLTKVDDPTHRKEKLQTEALARLESQIEEHRAAAVTAYEEEPHQNRKITVLAEVLKQASQGRVEHLLVAEGSRVWGTYSPETFTAIIETEQQPMSAELHNLAARITLQNSGRVTLLPEEQMPGGAQIAALLRY